MMLITWPIFKEGEFYVAKKHSQGHDGMRMTKPGFTGDEIKYLDLEQVQDDLKSLYLTPAEDHTFNVLKKLHPDAIEIWM